jgi:hypothetical protein
MVVLRLRLVIWKEIFQSKFRDKETIRLLDLKLNLEISITPMEAKALWMFKRNWVKVIQSITSTKKHCRTKILSLLLIVNSYIKIIIYRKMVRCDWFSFNFIKSRINLFNEFYIYKIYIKAHYYVSLNTFKF